MLNSDFVVFVPSFDLLGKMICIRSFGIHGVSDLTCLLVCSARYVGFIITPYILCKSRGVGSAQMR